MEKILTISIAAYNAADDITRCLDSMIFTEVAEKLDIIVVNDGSVDNTAEIVEEYVEKYPGIIRLVNKKNGGHGSTINKSIEIAVGKYYKIVDSDDWVSKEGIEKLVRCLESESVDLVLNSYSIVNANSGVQEALVRPYGIGQIFGISLPINKAENLNIYMHSVTVKTDLVKKMGPIIDENCFYVDMEYTIFPMQYVRNYMCFDFSVYEYLMGTDGQSMNKRNLVLRREQHLKVVKRIVTFYKENRLEDTVRKLVLHRIRLAVLNQYKIYFYVDIKEALEEIKGFDKWLKMQDHDIYRGTVGRYMKLIGFHRCTGFKFYKIIVSCMKRVNMEIEL